MPFLVFAGFFFLGGQAAQAIGPALQPFGVVGVEGVADLLLQGFSAREDFGGGERRHAVRAIQSSSG